MHKAYALAPCGHAACYDCLVSWFTAESPDNPSDLPVQARKKTCPHCRARVTDRPAQVWVVKTIAGALATHGGALSVEDIENRPAADPWKDIFRDERRMGALHRHNLAALLNGGDGAEDPVFGHGVFDAEDVSEYCHDFWHLIDQFTQGVYRCITCHNEIVDGVRLCLITYGLIS